MLLERLVVKQKASRLSDAAFAQRLGVPEGTWKPTRYGHKAVTARIARAAMTAFPNDPAIYADALAILLAAQPSKEDDDVAAARA